MTPTSTTSMAAIRPKVFLCVKIPRKATARVSTSMPVEGSRNTTISDSTRSTSKVRATVRTRTAKVNSRATMIPVIARHTTTIPATAEFRGSVDQYQLVAGTPAEIISVKTGHVVLREYRRSRK